MVGLAQQVRDALHMRGQPFRILRESRALVNNACHGTTIERAQLFFLCQRADEARVQLAVLRVAFDAIVEVGSNFEQLAKVGIVSA